ncbi:MAG: hypothetical protein NVSMB18_18840 [Acetobacteraceae bacterium]
MSGSMSVSTPDTNVPHDEAARVRLASSATTSPALLRQLADDPRVVVRAAVAISETCGPELDRLMSEDSDERVRTLLARRMARLLPELGDDELFAAAAHIRSTLAVLVQDEAVRVRKAVAEVVKSMPEAPHSLVLALANDTDNTVSDPVIRLSPVLTDADLLALVATPPHAKTMASVAGRPHLSAAVADAVVAHANAPVVRILLANSSACIQEATLDALVGQAAHNTPWHAALVRRPQLSARSVRALAEMVADDLCEVLVRRADIEPTLAAELRGRVATTIGAGKTEADGDEAILASIRRLNAANALNEGVLLEAACISDHRRIAAVLSIATGTSLCAVDRVAALRNGKALVSLAWKAGFSMRTGKIIQAMLGQIPTLNILLPGPGGAYPLSVEEMEWQLELLSEPGVSRR